MANRGVNLGGWFVLEKWITPSLFDGLSATDEYSFCDELGDKKFDKLESHRSHFITKQDLEWQAKNGVEIIRLPVGYWAFENVGPYVNFVNFFDKIFDWASEFGLKILVDVHAAPGSQNGNDHSGRSGSVKWAKPENVEATLNFINQVTVKYGHKLSLWGIELLNEPSNKIPRTILEDFYLQGYKIVRENCHIDCQVIISDGFEPWAWKSFMAGSKYENVLLDLHLYQVFGSDKNLSLSQHLKKTRKDWADLITKLNRPLIIGEWSIGLDPSTFEGMAGDEKRQSLQSYAQAQLEVFGQTEAWFFWTYKTETMPEWSYKFCVENKLINLDR